MNDYQNAIRDTHNACISSQHALAAIDGMIQALQDLHDGRYEEMAELKGRAGLCELRRQLRQNVESLRKKVLDMSRR